MKIDKKLYTEIFSAAEKTLSCYPQDWQRHQRDRLSQFSEEIALVYREGGTVIDLGGGDGIRSAICATLGMRAISVDFYRLNCEAHDHMPNGFQKEFIEAEDTARRLGVEFVNTDILKWRPELSGIDGVMSFDAIEHLHHSPRGLYKHLTEALRPGGIFLVGAPNAANLLKRMRIIFGGNVFSRFDDWYHIEFFTGHVREPTVEDLTRIKCDLGLGGVIFGRNWLGHQNFRMHKRLAFAADHLLRRFPSLCSDIYLYGVKIDPGVGVPAF